VDSHPTDMVFLKRQSRIAFMLIIAMAAAALGWTHLHGYLGGFFVIPYSRTEALVVGWVELGLGCWYVPRLLAQLVTRSKAVVLTRDVLHDYTNMYPVGHRRVPWSNIVGVQVDVVRFHDALIVTVMRARRLVIFRSWVRSSDWDRLVADVLSRAAVGRNTGGSTTHDLETGGLGPTETHR